MVSKDHMARVHAFTAKNDIRRHFILPKHRNLEDYGKSQFEAQYII